MATFQETDSFAFTNDQGTEVHVRHWAPEGDPKALLLISHGMQEHSGRYGRTAGDFTKAGYDVYALDHRGHGLTSPSVEALGRMGPGGWQGVVADVHLLVGQLRERRPGLPLVMLGHSWGSFILQAYVQRWGAGIDAVAFSGTNGANPLVAIGDVLSSAVVKVRGADRTAVLLEKVSVGHFNKAFDTGGPEITGKEWLSRDAAYVAEYVEDPLSGTPFPNGFFLELGRLLKSCWSPANERGIPKDLPLYLFAGTTDPVSNGTKGILPLIERYRGYGIEDLTYRFYEGGRHCMLNESNREEVLADLIAWFDARITPVD